MIRFVDPQDVRVGRVALVLALVVATLLAAPLLGLLSLESRALGREVGRAVDREGFPGAFEFEHITYGPGLYDVTAYGVVVRGRDGEPVLTAERVAVSLQEMPVLIKDVRTRLVVKRLEADGFDLRLEWNRFGDLLLTDAFNTRRFGLKTRPSPVVDVLVDLQEIVLRRGRLVLGWPAFGFHFDDISGSGAVRIDSEGLHIKVPRLGSGAGTTWLASAPERLRDAVSALPPNARSSAVAQGVAVPFDAVTFTDFLWQGQGFSTRLVMDGAGDYALDVGASMAFSKDDPIAYDYDLRVSGPASLFEALTGGRLTGFEGSRLVVKGKGAGASVAFGPAVASGLALGKLNAEDVSVPELKLDLSGESARFAVVADLGRLKTGTGGLSGAHAALSGAFGWTGFTAKAFLKPLLTPPTGAIGWATAFPMAARLELSAPSVKVVSLQRGEGAPKLDDLEVRGLKLTGTIGQVDLNVASVQAAGHGSAAINGKLETSVGFAGLTLAADLNATLAGVPRATLQALLPAGLLPAGTPDHASGAIRLTGDPLDPKSFAVESPWAAPAGAEPGANGAAVVPGAPGATP